MMSTWQKYLITTLTTLAACGFAANAMAQYIWLDEKGVKQFSDTPPPASVPKKRILKEPNGTSASAIPAADTATSSNGDKPATTAKAPMTTAERNADFNKRRAEQAEKEKKEAEAAQFAAEKAKNCERAKDYQRLLASNEPISQTNKNGERSYLNDAQRNQEMRDAKRVLEDCK